MLYRGWKVAELPYVEDQRLLAVFSHCASLCNGIDSGIPELDKACCEIARLNRLFNAKSDRCFDVAVDHGFFNEYGFLAGIENLSLAVRTLVAAAPDAIQLTVGQARFLQSLPGRQKPSLVLRTDVANVYGKELPRSLFSRMIENPVEQALRLDAACVVVNLFRIPDQPEVSDQCIQNILKNQTRVRSVLHAPDD